MNINNKIVAIIAVWVLAFLGMLLVLSSYGVDVERKVIYSNSIAKLSHEWYRWIA